MWLPQSAQSSSQITIFGCNKMPVSHNTKLENTDLITQNWKTQTSSLKFPIIIFLNASPSTNLKSVQVYHSSLSTNSMRRNTHQTDLSCLEYTNSELFILNRRQWLKWLKHLHKMIAPIKLQSVLLVVLPSNARNTFKDPSCSMWLGSVQDEKNGSLLTLPQDLVHVGTNSIAHSLHKKWECERWLFPLLQMCFLFPPFPTNGPTNC